MCPSVVPRHTVRGPVVEMLAGVATEVLKGALVGVEELGQRLIETDVVVTPPAEPEREHEYVDDAPLIAERDRRGAPINLALLSRRGLEAAQGQLGTALGRAQRADEEFDGLVAAGVAPSTQFLKQDLGGVPDLRGSRAQ